MHVHALMKGVGDIIAKYQSNNVAIIAKYLSNDVARNLFDQVLSL